MPYYKDLSDKLHFLSEADIANGGANYLPEGTVEITDEEAELIRLGNTPSPDPEEIKRQQRKELAEQMAESGIWETTLYAVMQVFINIAREKYPLQTSGLSDEQIIGAVVNPESPFYNEGAKRVYDKYELLKEL